MLDKIINSKSKTFLVFCFCFLFGVAVISIIDKKLNFVYLYILLFIIASFLIIYWQNKKVVFLIFCFLVFLLGIVRYELAFPLSNHNIVNFVGQNLTIQGYVAEEPDVREDRVNYFVKIINQNIKGNIYIKQSLYPRFNYGDQLSIKCDLTEPEAFDNFRYDRYLANLGVFVICNNPKVEKIGEGGGNFLMAGILQIKNHVSTKASQLWHEPYAGFIGGILYGYRGGLGNLNDLFAKTGLTHIVAVSGYNVTIVASILMTIFINLKIRRQKAFWFICVLIVLFVIFSGGSASALRAGIMGILVLVARQIGRLSRMSNVLLFTAVLMVLVNPFVIFWDVGFQLSFLSTLGLVYFPKFILRRSASDNEGSFGAQKLQNTKIFCSPLFIRCERFLSACRRIGIIECLSAIIATFPLILFTFGRLSIIALPVNILVLWIIPFLMLGGFLAIIFGFIFYPLGLVIAWFTWLGMKYVTLIVEFFGNWKYSALEWQLPWWGMVALYAGMIYLFTKRKGIRN